MTVRDAIETAIEWIEEFNGGEYSETLEYIKTAKSNRDTLAVAIEYIEEAIGNDTSETLDCLIKVLEK